MCPPGHHPEWRQVVLVRDGPNLAFPASVVNGRTARVKIRGHKGKKNFYVKRVEVEYRSITPISFTQQEPRHCVSEFSVARHIFGRLQPSSALSLYRCCAMMTLAAGIREFFPK